MGHHGTCSKQDGEGKMNLAHLGSVIVQHQAQVTTVQASVDICLFPKPQTKASRKNGIHQRCEAKTFRAPRKQYSKKASEAAQNTGCTLLELDVELGLDLKQH